MLPERQKCWPAQGLAWFAPTPLSGRLGGHYFLARPGSVQVTAADKKKVQFKLQQQVDFGDGHRIVGSPKELGKWSAENAPDMAWNAGDIWTLDLELPAGRPVEFKCVRVSNGNVEWEACDNRTLKVPNGASADVSVGFTWNEGSLDMGTAAPPAEVEAGSVVAATDDGQQSLAEAARRNGGSSDRPEHLKWQGRETRFMQSNEHSRERRGVWDTSGLLGAAKALVDGDREAASWLKKIQVAKELLVDRAGRHPDLDALACAFVYLQWINTGAIECFEGGGHYRPNKHAELAREIFKSMERCIGDDKAEPLLKLIARKTQTKLPAFGEQFTQSTPLTRIRDIAHRGDIPHELKQEIKHTIQNKLHRNAGPEDLVATEALLERVTADGGYSGDFVRELATFAGELRDFFNAGSLGDMLADTRAALEDEEAKTVDAFLDAKGRADGAAGQEALGDIIAALHSLTSLRALLVSKLSSGLRNDASDASIAMRQKFRLCEIRAEDYAFVLASRVLNVLEEQGGPESLAGGQDSGWALPLGAAVLCVRHVGLGGWQTRECMALENEIGTWQQAGGFGERENALRLKATLERARRLTQAFTDSLLSVFPPRAAALGKALGIEEERVQVFTEAEVRANLVFQLSKLCSLLLKAARLGSGGASWDALVAGEAVGELLEVERVDAAALRAVRGPAVLLVREASGDEELGACGGALRGVVLCHGLPHLSHLGVRARQEGVVFVACEDESVIDEEVRPLVGSRVSLQARPDSVVLAAAAGEDSTGEQSQSAEPGAKPSSSTGAQKIQKVKRGTCIPLSEATVERCGSKSAACARIARLAEAAGFTAAGGACLPFGNMYAAIRDSKRAKDFEGLLLEAETAEAEEGALDAVCEKLQELVTACPPNEALCKQAAASFEGGATLIVRSSANVEDLAGLSGAGLYDSVANVAATDNGAVAAAVARVWASLYTRRAVLSRRAAGVAQREAAMAVLIQEQLTPEMSFVLHTRSPLDGDDGVLVAELAVGLGETLASGTRGSPWRLSVEKATGEVDTLAFANFSEALGQQKRSGGEPGGFGRVCVDYSRQEMSTTTDERARMGRKLAELGASLEREFGGPQDVEGGIAGSTLFVVQTRPQP